MLGGTRLRRRVWTKTEVVPGEGVQPSWAFARVILGHVRIAVPPPRQLVASHYRRATRFLKRVDSLTGRFQSARFLVEINISTNYLFVKSTSGFFGDSGVRLP